MTLIENESEDKRELLQGLYPYAGRAHIIGFTGSPGAGKSTTVDAVISLLRSQDKRVGVLAVDPSSPFTGGALLGDRVRMLRHSADPGVYIRSMGSRGSLGGLAKSTREMLYVLEAYGCDVILLETVGVGQSELDVMSIADSVVLVLTPGAGDHVQTAKAGIMEIADVFVVNKADLPGADALVRELQLMLREKLSKREEWTVPIVRTVATEGTGIDDIWTALTNHLAHIKEHGYWQLRRQARHKADTLRLVEAKVESYLEHRAKTDERWREILERQLHRDPYESADEIMRDLPWIRM
jgi:LAO/AO transport system kinase